MELKILFGVFYAIGVPSFIWGILLNMGTWKADVLFVISTVFSVIYGVYFVRKLIDMDAMRKLNIRKEKREFERGSGEAPAPEENKFNSRIDRLNNDGDMFRNFK